MNIILIGAQGSGKGTQAQKLVEKYHLKHFSTGDALRAEAASGSPLGLKVKAIMEAGELVSAEIVNEIVKNAVEKHQEQGIIFDGYPRTLEQAAFLESVAEIDAVVEIEITDDEAVKRISSRYSCPKCKAVYNTQTKPPKKVGVCDNDGEAIVQREDDKEAAVRKRLSDYHAQTEPIIDYYEDNEVSIYRIDGQRPVDEVFEELCESLG